MRTATAALTALINAGQQSWVRADLYTFYDASDAVLGRWTNVDAPITVAVNGVSPLRTFASDGPLFKRGSIRFVVGVEVSEMDLEISALPTDLLNGVPWLQAIRSGALDGGRVVLERFMSDSWSNVAVGTVVWFGGRVSQVPDVSRSRAKLKIKSDLNLLNLTMPRELYKPECNNMLYDAKCGLSRTPFTKSSAVASGSTVYQINCTLTEAAGYFDLGKITFTSGDNSGVTRGIKTYTPGALVLNVPLDAACAVADTFDVVPGCDKLKATCGVNSAIAFTVNTGVSAFNLNATAHGLSDNQAMFLSNSGGALPAPLSAATRYFVVNATADTLQVATTLGGSPVTLTTNGTGTNTISQYGKFANLPKFRGTPFVPAPEMAK